LQDQQGTISGLFRNDIVVGEDLNFELFKDEEHPSQGEGESLKMTPLTGPKVSFTDE